MIRFFTILFSFLLLVVHVHAQHPYIPIPKDSATWIMVEEDWHEGQPPQTHTFTYDVGRTEGVDTLFNGKIYSCYFGDWQSHDMPPPPPKSLSAKSGLYFRQDSVTKKVYFFPNQGLNYTEAILYDFSLQKGDTINDTNYYCFSPSRLYPYKAWVDNVDSIYWTDGTWRYRWWIKSQYGPSTNPAKAIVIEGMGYTTHFIDDPLLEYKPLVAYTNKVVCHKSKNEWLFKQNNPWNADCDTMLAKNIVPIWIENIFINELNQPMLYPNPVRAEGGLILNSYVGKLNTQYIIEAYSFTGQKILNKSIMPSEMLMLNQYNFVPGLYLFVIRTNEHTIYRQKVVVQ